jgi:hypothetical protein
MVSISGITTLTVLSLGSHPRASGQFSYVLCNPAELLSGELQVGAVWGSFTESQKRKISGSNKHYLSGLAKPLNQHLLSSMRVVILI